MSEATEGVKEQTQPLVTEQAQEAIQKTFKKIGLTSYLPPLNGQRHVGILGAGCAIEIASLTDYFSETKEGKPKIVAFDVDQSGKKFTEEYLRGRGDNFEYRLANITDRNSFEDDSYDLLVVRKPDIHSSDITWKKALENGFDRLKPNGVALITTSEDFAYRFLREQASQYGDVLLDYSIPDAERVGPFFNEYSLLLVRKR